MTSSAEARRNRHDPGFADRSGFPDLYRDRRNQVVCVPRRAVARGEIVPQVISEGVWDVVPGYITFRMLQHGRPVTSDTLRALVDDVKLPSLASRLPR